MTGGLSRWRKRVKKEKDRLRKPISEANPGIGKWTQLSLEQPTTDANSLILTKSKPYSDALSITRGPMPHMKKDRLKTATAS